MKKIRVCLGNITWDYKITLPYSSGLLRSYAEQDLLIKENVEWLPFFFIPTDGVQKLFEKIINPDIIGISCYMWNFNRSVKLMRLIKEKYPKCLILVGGSSSPNQEYDFFSDLPDADIIARGEGEITFKKILQNYISGYPKLSEIKGIIYKENDNIIDNGIGETLSDNFNFPSPYVSNYYEENIKDLDSRGLDRLCLIETTKGCPFTCLYCSDGNKKSIFRKVNIDRIYDEVDYIGSHMDEVMFVDTNFGIFERDYDIVYRLLFQSNKNNRLQLCHIENGGLGFSDNARNRLIEISKLVESKNLLRHREGVTISLQTLTKKVLSNIKRKEITTEQVLSFQNKLTKENIPHSVELIAGLPGETLDSMLDSYEKVLDGKPDDVRVYGLMMLPNTEVSSQKIIKQYEIVTRSPCFLDSKFDDEKEYITQAIGTKDFPKKDLEWFLKFREFFQYAYLGKWLYFISEYLNKKYKMRRVDFHKNLMLTSSKNSVVEKCIKGWYINNWNSGSYVSYKGPISPYNIEWGENYFSKNTFHWLCISKNMSDFYNEIEDFLVSIEKMDDEIKDVLKFQKESIIKIDFDNKLKQKMNYKYNWFEYFNNNKPLEKIDNYIIYTTKYKKNNIKNFFYQAGGHPHFFHKIKRFIHRDAEIYYNDKKVIYKSNYIGRSIC